MTGEISPSDTFNTEFKQWRASRPAWSKLVQAVRAVKPSEELVALAAEAGASRNEVAELLHVVRMARAAAPRAAALPAAQKHLAALDKEVERCRETVEAASAAEHAQAVLKLSIAKTAREKFYLAEVLEAEQAERYIREVVEPMGLA